MRAILQNLLPTLLLAFPAQALDAAEVEIASLRWEVTPSAFQEPALYPSLGSGVVFPGTLLCSGELTLTRVDLALPGRMGLGLELRRVRRSGTLGSGPFGPGWELAYRQRLRELWQGGTVELYDGDGRRELFEVGAGGYLAPAGRSVTLEKHGAGWVLIVANGERRYFDRFGRLVAIADAGRLSPSTGSRIELSYNPWHGQLEQPLVPVYEAAGHVAALLSPAGVVVARYRYGPFGEGLQSRVDAVAPRVDQVRVERTASGELRLQVEFSEEIDGRRLPLATVSGDLGLEIPVPSPAPQAATQASTKETTAPERLAIEVHTPVLDGRRARKRIIVTTTAPPLAGTELELTIEPEVIADLFANPLAEPFRVRFTVPAAGSAPEILLDAAGKGLEIVRDPNLSAQERWRAARAANAQIPFWLGEELLRGTANTPRSFALNVEGAAEDWAEAAVHANTGESFKLYSRGTGRLAFAFVEGVGLVEGARAFRGPGSKVTTTTEVAETSVPKNCASYGCEFVDDGARMVEQPLRVTESPSPILAADEVFEQAAFAEAFGTGPEVVRGFRIFGNKGLVGPTYQRNILLLEAQQVGATSPRALLRAFEAEARAAGASELRILGHAVVNEKLMNPGLAQRLGYTFRQINDGTIELVKSLGK